MSNEQFVDSKVVVTSLFLNGPLIVSQMLSLMVSIDSRLWHQLLMIILELWQSCEIQVLILEEVLSHSLKIGISPHILWGNAGIKPFALLFFR